jgi:hypothetical protein
MREIAETFSLSISAVHRHKSHVSQRLVEAHAEREASESRTLAERLTELARFGQSLAEKAAADGDLKTALLGCRELARLLQIEAQTSGELQNAPTINVAIWQNFDFTRLSRADLDNVIDRAMAAGGRVPVTALRRLWEAEPDDA